MKKSTFTLMLISLISFAFGQPADLNGVTFGFSAGYSHTFDKTYDYSLTTDANHNLKLQPLSNNAFVISSVVMVKLGKIAVDQKTDKLVKHSTAKDATGYPFWGHLSIDLALDLVNVAPDASFNKNINGGLGIGYFIMENCQLAIFYDMSQISQLRDYVINSYQDKPIPNGSGTNYTSLDNSDHNLFYNKTISGFSFKFIFSLANKKAN